MGDEGLLERILDGEEEPKDLPLALLQSITKDFSEENKIGQGGFGEVYKGELRNGSIVAVKRIDVNIHTIDDMSFRREFHSLMTTSHQNVVRFLGFCSNTHHTPRKEAGEINLVNVRERLLCFEYIHTGSLDKHITDELRGLEWEPRYAIISGICDGLFYLHGEKKIVHMDLKPPNILLDDHMVPKITDFGLSRSNEKSHTMGQRFGTPGYIAPEYEKDGKTSFKCDIYSLGVIIIEVITGHKIVPHKNNVLRRWRHRWNKPPTLVQYQQLTKCIEIAVRCRQQEPEARPSIGDIMGILSEPERTSGHTSQESTYLDDDMLGIEPLKLMFDEEMSWSVKLTNKTKACFAFSIEGPSKEYTIEPDKGILTPGCSECLVQIAVTAPQATHNADKLIVQSTKVNASLRVEDITNDIFHEVAGKVVDEVDLMVVYEPVATPTRMAIISRSYKDIARGKLDRRNFHPPENYSSGQRANMTYLLRVGDRAMDVTRGAMGSLLHKLGVLHKDEFHLETSVKEDANSLSKELVKMHTLLRKVSEVEQDNLDDMARLWTNNVREMSYDLEDFVDGFLVHSEPDYNMSGFRELTHELCFLLDKDKSHHTMSDLIKDKNKQVQDAAIECKEYMVDIVEPNAAAKAAINDIRSFVIHKHKKELVGIETPRDEIIRIFEEDTDSSEQNLKILSIVGLGGLGKTTLAKAVYDKLKARFNIKTFVSVGQNPNVKKVLENIIRKIDKKEFNADNLDVGDVIQKLQELLEDKRYLVVIDDLWDSEAWGLIQSAFPETECGSRLITTTRIYDVALATCNAESKYVYRIKPLSDEDSRTLFLRRTFGPKKVSPDTPRIEEILIDILKRCGGMPLAIISIASLLSGKTGSTWEYVWKSLGAMTKGDDLEKMKQILDLSYIHLPGHLKTCLLYVCMYPENHEIDKYDLLRQWVAEGFVIAYGQLDAEDVAEKYFKELIGICMIQPGRIDDYSNEVLSCRVHDIILDLLRSKSSKDNFIHVIDGTKDETETHGEIRRISVHYNDKEDSAFLGTIKGPLLHARTVLLYRGSLPTCFLGSKYVRVLHIEHDFTSLDLTGISRLFLLRYLKVGCNPYSDSEVKLPNQIGQLQQLETIDIYGAKLRSYPSDIVSLPWLSYLRYGGDGIVLPDGIDRLKSLCTLEGVCVYNSSVESIMGLGKLTNLRKLHIFSMVLSPPEEAASTMRMNALHSSISRLSASLKIFSFSKGSGFHLDASGWSSRTLFLGGSHILELDLSGCNFKRCPEWIGQLHDLYKFSIWVEEVADGVSTVARLPSLAYFELKLVLHISVKEKEESVVIPGGGAFQALKHLVFHCTKASLTFEVGAMPKLEKLDILFRYDMAPQFLPIGIQHLPADTLKEIRLNVAWYDMEVVGCQDWDEGKWEDYLNADEYHESYRQHKIYVRLLLKGAFKPHLPDADIAVYFECLDDEEDDETVNDEVVSTNQYFKLDTC